MGAASLSAALAAPQIKCRLTQFQSNKIGAALKQWLRPGRATAAPRPPVHAVCVSLSRLNYAWERRAAPGTATHAFIDRPSSEKQSNNCSPFFQPATTMRAVQSWRSQRCPLLFPWNRFCVQMTAITLGSTKTGSSCDARTQLFRSKRQRQFRCYKRSFERISQPAKRRLDKELPSWTALSLVQADTPLEFWAMRGPAPLHIKEHRAPLSQT